MSKPKVAFILGPTAAGKSSLALELAGKFRGEILSADSVQVYRGLDIGTAKPSAEERDRVPHHLIDILDPDQEYSAASFREQADRQIRRLHQKGLPVFVVGGTGLYLRALSKGLFRGPGPDPQLRSSLRQKAEAEGQGALFAELQRLDPAAASRIHPHDLFRLTRALEVFLLSRKPISEFQEDHGFRENPYLSLKIGLRCEREELYRRIESRVEAMLEKGWLEEVRGLLAQGRSPRLKPMQSLGYKRMVSYLEGELEWTQAVRLIKQDTRRYAKRQITWFKTDPEIEWYPADKESYPSIERRVEAFFLGC